MTSFTRPPSAGRFPRSIWRYTLSLLLVALTAAASIVQWNYSQMSPLEQYYLPAYIRSAAAPLIGLRTGDYQILSGQTNAYRHVQFHIFLRDAVYQRSLLDLLRMPLLVAGGIFGVGLLWSVPRDVRRSRERRQGRRNKGPELVTVSEFNRRTKGDGLRIEQGS